MDDYTIVMTVVLTAQDMGMASEISEKVREYLRLWHAAYEGVEVNTMQESRRGATIDDVIPAKIVITAED